MSGRIYVPIKCQVCLRSKCTFPIVLFVIRRNLNSVSFYTPVVNIPTSQLRLGGYSS